ncbi:MAG: ABC transporter substrate-binding protein [Proteobacteria bacterium]|nr:ABC transporter substrate-binding protein [Pseudomonadota bacterium]
MDTRAVIRVAGIAATIIAASASLVNAADKVKVVVPHSGLWDTRFVGYGIESGIFKKNGLDVSVIKTRGGAETLQAAITGNADIAIATGTFSVIAAYDAGAPLRIIGNEIEGVPDINWYVRADSKIKSLNDMAGRTHAYSRPGSSSHMVSLELAETFKNMTGKTMKLVSTGGFSDTYTQVMTGQVDAGFTVFPFRFDKIKQGVIRLALKGSDATALQGVSVRVQVAHAKFLKERRPVAKKFLKVYWELYNWAYANPKQSTALVAKAWKIDPNTIGVAPDYIAQKYMTPAPVRGIDKLNQLAVKHKFIKKPLSKKQLKELIDIVYDPRSS